MMFVDGENFTLSLQRLALAENVVLLEGEHHVADVFAWSPTMLGHANLAAFAPLVPNSSRAIRSYFYTSCPGDEHELTRVERLIWARGFAPEVFKKPKGGRSKGVDITLARDLLSHCFEDHLDVAVLVAGDADYVPLVEEVKRRGKRVLVAFLGKSPSLSPRLKFAADAFGDLGPFMLQTWANYAASCRTPPQP